MMMYWTKTKMGDRALLDRKISVIVGHTAAARYTTVDVYDETFTQWQNRLEIHDVRRLLKIIPVINK